MHNKAFRLVFFKPTIQVNNKQFFYIELDIIFQQVALKRFFDYLLQQFVLNVSTILFACVNTDSETPSEPEHSLC